VLPIPRIPAHRPPTGASRGVCSRPVPTVRFTANLQRHVPSPSVDVTGATVAECLAAVFDENPRARGYVLDEHGALR
jgi:hypothetical protein